MKHGEIWYVDFGETAVGHEYKKNRQKNSHRLAAFVNKI